MLDFISISLNIASSNNSYSFMPHVWRSTGIARMAKQDDTPFLKLLLPPIANYAIFTAEKTQKNLPAKYVLQDMFQLLKLLKKIPHVLAALSIRAILCVKKICAD